MNADTFTVQDGIDAALILLPLACLIIGAGLGIVATKFGHFILYREHLDQHSYAKAPNARCPFCREERIFQAAQTRELA
jgi:hypothetical protein